MTTEQPKVAASPAAISIPPMPAPPKQTIAAAIVALMVTKGGTLRLRKSELAKMEDYVVTVQPSPSNPDVVHIGVMTRAEMQERVIKEVLASAGVSGEKTNEPEDGEHS